MDFRDYAAKETSALLTRVTGGAADASRQRLKAFRSAIEGATKALESALTTPPQFEQELTELVARLGKAAAADAEASARRASDEARSAHDALRKEQDGLRKELKEALEAKASTANALQAAIEAKEATAASLKTATEAKNAAAAALKTTAEAKESLAATLKETQSEKDHLATALKTMQAEKEGLASALAAQTREKDAAARAAGELRAEVDKVRSEAGKVRAEADKLRADVEKLRTDLNKEHERVGASRLELVKATDDLKKAEYARAEAIVARDKEAQIRAAAQEELQAMRRHVEAARAETDSMSSQLESVFADRARLEEALAESQNQVIAIAANVKEVTSISEANASRIRELEDAEEAYLRERQELEMKLSSAMAAGQSQARRDTAAVSLLDSLVASFENLANSRRIDDALRTMVQHLAAEFSRAASFRVKGNRLEGETQVGFDSKTDISKVVLPLGMDSLLSRAASSGRPEYLAGSELTNSKMPWAGAPTYALALPVMVNGEPLAILYADNTGDVGESGAAALELKARFADALVRHGVTILTRLASELRALAELRTYATSLVSEIEQMYCADHEAGRLPDELQGRLRANIEYARSIFANRTSLECPDAATLLEEELATIIASPETSPFSRDLGVVTGRTGARAAEAS